MSLQCYLDRGKNAKPFLRLKDVLRHSLARILIMTSLKSRRTSRLDVAKYKLFSCLVSDGNEYIYCVLNIVPNLSKLRLYCALF